MRGVRDVVVLLGLAVLALLLGTTAAVAHPGFRPGEVPAGGPVPVELVVPHGCGAEGDGSPTVEVVVQLSDQLALAPEATDGWQPFVEEEAAGWTDDGGATAAELVLPATVEVHAETGTTLDVAVFQECANGDAYRWAAAAGEDGDPAVRLTVVEGTPPPLPEPASPSPTADPSPAGTSAPSPAAPPTPTASATPAPTSTPSASPAPTVTPTPDASPTPQAAESADPGGPGRWLPALVAGAVLVAGGVYYLRIRRF